MPQESRRLKQVNTIIQQLFGEILNQEVEFQSGALVSVTKVKTSPDLRYAKIGLSIYPTQEADKIFASICKQLKHLKYLLHQKITFKYAPEIRVYLDTTAKEAEELGDLLDTLKKRRGE